MLNEIASKITQMNMVHPYLYGRKTILGVMPDWNPAEMIGTYPKTLALSLYEELITNNIWSKQRKRYGYRDVTDFPLLYDLGGIPYIDVRVSFNSFIPAGLPEDIGRKLCEYYIEKLTKNPNLHDKIEFEIVFSNFSFDIFDRAKALKKAGFKADEIEILISVLLEQTKKIIDDIWEDDIKKMKSLDNRRKKIMNSGLDDIAKIYWLLSDCKKYGTLPFAGLARMGFIAIQFLKSLKNIGIISEEDYFNFMGSLNLISSNIQYDKHHLSQAQFLSKYGHLRPGTYDILSHRYDEDYDKYFGKTKYLKIDLKEHRKSDFNFSDHQKVKINRILAEYNFKQSADEFIQLMKKAIEAREYSKFIFSHSVSDILRCIENISRENGICIEDAAFLNIKDIIQLYTSSGNIKRALEYSYKKGKQKYLITKQIKLPTLIINNKDIKIFSLLKSEPNFITQERVIGKVTLNMEENIEDNIVFLPSADPGFDWIFTHNIKGFVTMFGGANSHMAIRAGELGIPAVIGAGEKLYNIWSNYDFLELNCQNKYVKEVLLSSLSRDSYI